MGFFCHLAMEDGSVIKLRKLKNGILTKDKVKQYQNKCISVEMGDSCLGIGNRAFFGFTKLSKVKMGENVKSLGRACFAFCDSLTEIELSSSVEEIGEHSFFECIKLKEIKFHEGLKKIKGFAFCGCVSLSHVDLPTTVEINENAFEETNVKL